MEYDDIPYVLRNPSSVSHTEHYVHVVTYVLRSSNPQPADCTRGLHFHQLELRIHSSYALPPYGVTYLYVEQSHVSLRVSVLTGTTRYADLHSSIAFARASPSPRSSPREARVV
jgi:hypothetical protein